MTKNNIEIGVKLVADSASAEEVKQDITKKVASLQAAANQVKGKKGEGIRINLSSLMKEANAIDVSEASKDPIAFTQTLSDFYEKIAKNAKTTYLSLEKKQKAVAKELTDLQNQSEAANKSLLDSQNAYENAKNKGLKKDDSGKKIHDSDFRIGAYDKEKGTEGFFGVSRAYASASVVQDIASTHNLSGINTRADLFKLAKEQPENKNVQDAVEEVNKALEKWAAGPLKGIMAYSEEHTVSSDYISNRHSSIVDALDTQVVGGNMVKIVAWYDNEWGYSLRVNDLAAYISKLGF